MKYVFTTLLLVLCCFNPAAAAVQLGEIYSLVVCESAGTDVNKMIERLNYRLLQQNIATGVLDRNGVKYWAYLIPNEVSAPMINDGKRVCVTVKGPLQNYIKP